MKSNFVGLKEIEDFPFFNRRQCNKTKSHVYIHPTVQDIYGQEPNCYP